MELIENKYPFCGTENKYYTFTDKDSYQWIFKYKNTINEEVYTYYYIYDGIYNGYECYLFDDYEYDCKEVDIKDITDLMPDSNIDKINYIRKQRIKSLLSI